MKTRTDTIETIHTSKAPALDKCGVLLTTTFAPETRFEVAAGLSAVGTFRATSESELDLLKSRLLLGKLSLETNPSVNALYRRAANKAATLAEVTEIPLLVFPLLFEELSARLIREYLRAVGGHPTHKPALVEAA